MRMLGVVDSFVGRWSANPLGWLALLLPTLGIVALQEGDTPFASPIDLVGSALAQHAVSGAIAIGVLALLRRLLDRVPFVIVILTWIVAGASRGVVGGIFAQNLAHVPPQFAERIATWVVMTLVWMPLISYFFAQLELRRNLLRDFSRLATALAEERRRAQLSAAQLRSEVVAAVQKTIAPLVHEVRASLTSATEVDGAAALEPISDRIEALVTTTHSIISAGGASDPAPTPVAPVPRWTLYGESLSVDRSRPLFATALTALALCSIYLLDAFRVGGPQNALLELVGLAVGCFIVYLLLVVVKRIPLFARFSTSGTLAALFLAGLSALIVILLLANRPFDTHTLNVASSLPGMFAFVGVMLSGATGVGMANLRLAPSVEALGTELEQLHAHSRARESQVAEQVNLLMHGPILGRLSACVMALNFYLAETHRDRGARLAATTEGVLVHLDRVSEDLDELGLLPG